MIDPLAFIEHALELLPDDPAATTSADLLRLVAMSEGLTRQMLAVHIELAAGERRASIHELARLSRLAHDCEQADRRVNTYTAAALEAHGITNVRRARA